MNSISPYHLPIETVLSFIKSVRKAVESHPNPSSDANLKEAKRLADELEADAWRWKRELEAKMQSQAREQQRKLETAQRKEAARVESREPGDFHSKPLI
jgi:hypothetical protein